MKPLGGEVGLEKYTQKKTHRNKQTSLIKFNVDITFIKMFLPLLEPCLKKYIAKKVLAPNFVVSLVDLIQFINLT